MRPDDSADVVGRDVRDVRHVAGAADGDDRDTPFGGGHERGMVAREGPGDEGVDRGIVDATGAVGPWAWTISSERSASSAPWPLRA